MILSSVQLEGCGARKRTGLVIGNPKLEARTLLHHHYVCRHRSGLIGQGDLICIEVEVKAVAAHVRQVRVLRGACSPQKEAAPVIRREVDDQIWKLDLCIRNVNAFRHVGGLLASAGAVPTEKVLPGTQRVWIDVF